MQAADVVGRRLLLGILLTAAVLATAGCESGSDGPDSYSVEYLVAGDVIADGSADLVRVVYDDADGEQSLEFDPPEEGWSTSLDLLPGDTIYLRAEGTVVSGRFVLQVQIVGDDGSMRAYTNDAEPWEDGDVYVEIPREQLP
jgi:hypothetical protein